MVPLAFCDGVRNKRVLLCFSSGLKVSMERRLARWPVVTDFALKRT